MRLDNSVTATGKVLPEILQEALGAELAGRNILGRPVVDRCHGHCVMTSRPRVGVLGAGKVGAVIAAVLAREGHSVVVHNRTRHKADKVAADVGGIVADRAQDLTAQCAIVYGCLSGWEAISASYCGPAGLLSGAAPAGRVFVGLGTLDPAQVRELDAAVKSAGHHFLYASVSGRPVDLKEGRGFVMASGPADVAEQVLPVLRTLGVYRYVGPDSAHAAVMKLAMNLMVFASLCSTGEALALAERSGIDRGAAYDLLLQSPVGSSLLELRRQAFLEPDQITVQATVDLVVENYEMVRQLAAATGTAAPQADATSGVFSDASARGYGARDATAIAEYIRSLAQDSLAGSTERGEERTVR